MAIGVPRRDHDPQRAVADAKSLAIAEGNPVHGGPRAVLGAGVVLQHALQFVNRKTTPGGVVVQGAVLRPLQEIDLHHGNIELSHERARAVPDQCGDQSLVIGVVVRRDEVGSLEVHADLREAGLQGLLALGSVHARIDDQIAILGGEHERVDFPERISGKRDHDSVEAGQDLFHHLPFPRWPRMITELISDRRIPSRTPSKAVEIKGIRLRPPHPVSHGSRSSADRMSLHR